MKPPLSLAFPTYVIEYAIVPKTIKHVPSKKLWAGNRWLGAVPRLAICKDYLSGDYFLMHCDDEWQLLCGVESRNAIEEVKQLAEKHYPEINNYWNKTEYVEPDARKKRNEIINENACSFCEKSNYDEDTEITSMITSNGLKICNVCITLSYELINDKNT